MLTATYTCPLCEAVSDMAHAVDTSKPPKFVNVADYPMPVHVQCPNCKAKAEITDFRVDSYYGNHHLRGMSNP